MRREPSSEVCDRSPPAISAILSPPPTPPEHQLPSGVQRGGDTAEHAYVERIFTRTCGHCVLFIVFIAAVL